VDTALLSHEQTLRGTAFFGALVLLAFWEAAGPRRMSTRPTAIRWTGNQALGVLGTLLVRVLLPVLPIGIALLGSERGWGLLNRLEVPAWLSVGLTPIALDLTFYFEHRILHAVPVLWRFHQVHHADLDLDITTGLRFHPLEAVALTAVNMAIVLALGLPAAGVLVYEVLVSVANLFSHGNVELTIALDRVLRRLVVTPEMHRVHHSALAVEGNSNFGSMLPVWDRLFGTYRAEPAAREAMTIGLTDFRDRRCRVLWWMLWHPFSRRAGA
jgi:sterol desaturase/sphingolipid hydroxylase (fatty acid hydroxylase superfamily)